MQKVQELMTESNRIVTITHSPNTNVVTGNNNIQVLGDSAPDVQEHDEDMVPTSVSDISVLQSENESLRRQLAEEKERSAKYWGMIEKLMNQMN